MNTISIKDRETTREPVKEIPAPSQNEEKLKDKITSPERKNAHDFLIRPQNNKGEQLKSGAMKMFSPSKASKSYVARCAEEIAEGIQKELIFLYEGLDRLKQLRDSGEIDSALIEFERKEAEQSIKQILNRMSGS